MSDEPTEITEDGIQIWRNSKGRRHRDYDLPAKIYSDGRCEWWVNGEFIKRTKCTKKEIEEYKKPHYLQRQRNIRSDRFKNLIKGG